MLAFSRTGLSELSLLACRSVLALRKEIQERKWGGALLHLPFSGPTIYCDGPALMYQVSRVAALYGAHLCLLLNDEQLDGVVVFGLCK